MSEIVLTNQNFEAEVMQSDIRYSGTGRFLGSLVRSVQDACTDRCRDCAGV